MAFFTVCDDSITYISMLLMIYDIWQELHIFGADKQLCFSKSRKLHNWVFVVFYFRR